MKPYTCPLGQVNAIQITEATTFRDLEVCPSVSAVYLSIGGLNVVTERFSRTNYMRHKTHHMQPGSWLVEDCGGNVHHVEDEVFKVFFKEAA